MFVRTVFNIPCVLFFAGFPFVIRARDNGIFKSSGTAYAWLALDSGCQFHYQILFDDMDISQDHKASAYLAKYSSHVNSPLNPGYTKMIGKFHSSIVSKMFLFDKKIYPRISLCLCFCFFHSFALSTLP